MRWKWSNIPIPEAYVILLVAGIILHLFVPLRLFPKPWIGHTVGWPVTMAGLFLASWSVYAVKEMDIRKPTKIISTGPYAFSRNPMYVGCALINLGVALIVNTTWPIILLPVALIFTHIFNITREERYLKGKFGDEYRQYQSRVRRYL